MVKVNVEKYLGLKTPIEVKQSVKNTRETMKIQLSLVKISKLVDQGQDTNDSEATEKNIEIMKKISEVSEEMELFVMSILRLDDKKDAKKYLDKMDDLTQDQLGELVNMIAEKVMGTQADNAPETKKA